MKQKIDTFNFFGERFKNARRALVVPGAVAGNYCSRLILDVCITTQTPKDFFMFHFNALSLTAIAVPIFIDICERIFSQKLQLKVGIRERKLDAIYKKLTRGSCL